MKHAIYSALLTFRGDGKRVTIELFDARALAPLVEFLSRNGTLAESFLGRVRIPAELIEAGGWVAKRQAYDLTYDIVQRTGCPHAVFSAYLDFQLKHLGPIGDAMRSCKTVKEALDVAIQLGGIAYEGSEFRLRIEGDTTWLSYQEPKVVSAGQTFINDMTLMVYYHLIRMTADQNWRPTRLRTKGILIERHRSLEMFEDCQTEVHPDYSALAFPTEFLSRRLSWQGVESRLDGPETWQFGPEGSEPVFETLYRLLASRFPYHGLPTLDQLAWLVAVSPATLKRQLAAAGTTYSKLLDRIRFDTACKMLSIPELTVKEIAHELGYSGTNNFVRSFRRMTGVTPGQYRQQQNT